MKKDTKIVESWYVCFNKSMIDHWLLNMLEPHFQHCFLVREEGDKWLIINTLNSHTRIHTEFIDDYPHIRALAINCVILKVESLINPNVNQWHLNIFNCVEVVKSILGIHDWLLLTPYQLYKRILKCQQTQSRFLKLEPKQIQRDKIKERKLGKHKDKKTRLLNSNKQKIGHWLKALMKSHGEESL